MLFVEWIATTAIGRKRGKMHEDLAETLAGSKNLEGNRETVPLVEEHEFVVTQELAERSVSFVGRWNRLVSSTNWEKGRIIQQWRQTLQEAGCPATQYSDDAWSKLTGQISPQHAGRLRRVYERFGDVQSSYNGLYWSHFLAAIDWQDAELWLEGAAQGEWSIPKMKEMRREATGEVSEGPLHAEVLGVPFEDEVDYDDYHDSGETLLEHGSYERSASPSNSDSAIQESKSKAPSDDDVGNANNINSASNAVGNDALLSESLPDDLVEAFELCKIAILRHKASGWQQTTPEAVAMQIDILKAIVYAPSGE